MTMLSGNIAMGSQGFLSNISSIKELRWSFFFPRMVPMIQDKVMNARFLSSLPKGNDYFGLENRPLTPTTVLTKWFQKGLGI